MIRLPLVLSSVMILSIRSNLCCGNLDSIMTVSWLTNFTVPVMLRVLGSVRRLCSERAVTRSVIFRSWPSWARVLVRLISLGVLCNVCYNLLTMTNYSDCPPVVEVVDIVVRF